MYGYGFRRWLWLLAGILVGTLGFKILSSMDAKKLYAQITAAFLRGKEYIMTNVTKLQENACDIFAEANDINKARCEGPEVIKDTSTPEAP